MSEKSMMGGQLATIPAGREKASALCVDTESEAEDHVNLGRSSKPAMNSAYP